jgi:hypothetical protein
MGGPDTPGTASAPRVSGPGAGGQPSRQTGAAGVVTSDGPPPFIHNRFPVGTGYSVRDDARPTSFPNRKRGILRDLELVGCPEEDKR